MSELLNCDWGYFQVTPFVITQALPRCETLTILFFGKKTWLMNSLQSKICYTGKQDFFGFGLEPVIQVNIWKCS